MSLWQDRTAPPSRRTTSGDGKKKLTTRSNASSIMESKWNGKITGSRRVTCFTTVFGNTWSRTIQPICTLFAVWRACVLGAADTWLGYISALVTKRHEPRGGNHGSRDFCQRRTPVIAEELICNLKPISEQILFQPGGWGVPRWLLASARTPEITSWGFESQPGRLCNWKESSRWFLYSIIYGSSIYQWKREHFSEI